MLTNIKNYIADKKKVRLKNKLEKEERKALEKEFCKPRTGQENRDTTDTLAIIGRILFGQKKHLYPICKKLIKEALGIKRETGDIPKYIKIQFIEITRDIVIRKKDKHKLFKRKK